MITKSPKAPKVPKDPNAPKVPKAPKSLKTSKARGRDSAGEVYDDPPVRKVNGKGPKGRAMQVPRGYTLVASNSASGEIWEYEQQPELRGTIVGAVREVTVGKGKSQRTSRVATVEAADGGLYTLWESGSLRAFFDAIDDGTEVCVQYHGLKDIGRQQPMKDFHGYVRD